MDDVKIVQFQPEDRDWLVEQHQLLYTRDEGFDDTFGPLVGRIADAFLADHDPRCERGWVAWAGGRRIGCIFCVRLDADTAKLRLFLLTPHARGRGLGRRLLAQCMGFARAAGYRQMQLWTHESHQAACSLYAKTGWELAASKAVTSFGQRLVEQTWKITL